VTAGRQLGRLFLCSHALFLLLPTCERTNWEREGELWDGAGLGGCPGAHLMRKWAFFIHPFIRSFVRSFTVYSSICPARIPVVTSSFIHSFIHLFIRMSCGKTRYVDFFIHSSTDSHPSTILVKIHGDFFIHSFIHSFTFIYQFFIHVFCGEILYCSLVWW